MEKGKKDEDESGGKWKSVGQKSCRKGKKMLQKIKIG